MKSSIIEKIFSIKVILYLFCMGIIHFFSLFVYLHNIAWAHEEKTVHSGLTNCSFAIQIPSSSFYSKKHLSSKSDARQGSVDEDKRLRFFGHFYNPETGKGLKHSPLGPATVRAEKIWHEALSRYRAGQLQKTDGAFHSLGRVLHLLQDMTSPAHVHDDKHGDGDDFEDWGLKHFPNYNCPDVKPKFASARTASAFVHDLASLTYNMTAYQAELDEVEGGQPASELAQMFPTLHRVDVDFGSVDYWEIDNIGSFGKLGLNEWWIVDEKQVKDHQGRDRTQRIRGLAYIENAGGNGDQELIPQVFDDKPNTAKKSLLQLYGDYLYPETVAYGAGLLQLFAEEVATVKAQKE